MANGEESGEGRLTAEKAAQRSKEGFRKAGALDLTPPFKKPLTEADITSNLEGPVPTQAEVALGQSLEKGKALRDANPPKVPESPGQKIRRLARGEPR